MMINDKEVNSQVKVSICTKLTLHINWIGSK